MRLNGHKRYLSIIWRWYEMFIILKSGQVFMMDNLSIIVEICILITSLERPVFGYFIYNNGNARIISKCTPKFENKSTIDGWKTSTNPVSLYLENGIYFHSDFRKLNQFLTGLPLSRIPLSNRIKY